MKRLSFTIAAIFISTLCFAQTAGDYIKAADKYFANGDYFSAATYYEKSLAAKAGKGGAGFSPYEVNAVKQDAVSKHSSSKEQVIFNLGESYRMLHLHEKAIPYYAQAAAMPGNPFPLAGYHHAASLKALGRYDEARTAFQSFKSSYTGNDIYAAATERELKSLDFIQQQLAKKDLNKYKVAKATGMDAEGGTYAPVWLNNETLLFTSTRPESGDNNKSNTNRIYQASYANGAASNISKTTVPQDKGIQQGVVAVTPTGNTLYLTRWEINKGKKLASIYSSTRTGDVWSTPALASSLNVEGSSTQQPSVTADGKYILFSSDRAGGSGGFDIWMADLNGDAISNVRNLGPNINTAWDEQAPSYHAASNKLVYSSNGRVGMGNFDLYYVSGGLNNLGTPENFGYPVNSIKDDLYFVSRGSEFNILEDVLLSSDREDDCCLELFALQKIKLPKTITGRVVACDTKMPLSGVTVVVTDANNNTVTTKTTDASGSYTFTAPEFVAFKATATQKGYFTGNVNFDGPADKEADDYAHADICINLIPEKAIRVENVYYDYDKATLRSESFPALDSLVQLLNDNPTMLIELAAHTDSRGGDDYNQNLSNARAQSVVDYLITKGIDKGRLLPKGYGESMPVAPNENTDGTDNPEGRQMNRRTEFRVIKN
jgi:OOP family OmpA-OmpF porin